MSEGGHVEVTVVGQAEHVTLPLSAWLRSLGEQIEPWAKLQM